MDMDDAPPVGGLAQDHRLSRHAIDWLVLVLARRAAFHIRLATVPIWLKIDSSTERHQVYT